MAIRTINKNNISVALIESDEVLITDARSAVELLAEVRDKTGCDSMIIPKTAVSEAFFDLKTCIAGEVLQKFVMYHMCLAIVGDFSEYTSQSLRDFMYETNKGRHIFFLPDEASAIKKLCMIK